MRIIYSSFACSLVILMLCVTSPSYAACPIPGIRVNEVYKYDPTPILQAMRDGKDPCPEWMTRGGFTGAPTRKGQVLLNSITPAHRPPVSYKDVTCNTYSETRAGGLSISRGATDPCQTGNGGALTKVNIPIVGIPKAEQEEFDCANGLLAGLSSVLSGKGAGFAATSGPAPIEASGRISRSGCASGSIGICGIGSISGSVCPGKKEAGVTVEGSPPLTKSNPPKYVELKNVPQFDYGRTPINERSTIYCTQSCIIEYKKGTPEYVYRVIPRGDYITMNSNGQIFGRNWTLNDTRGNPVRLTPVVPPTSGGPVSNTSYISVLPRYGLIELSEDFFKGRTIDGKGSVEFVDTTLGADPNATDSPLGEITVREEKNTGALAYDEDADKLGAFTPVDVIVEAPPVTYTGTGSVVAQP